MMKNKGFTLIELLAVIIILAIIALISVPTILNIIEKSKEKADLETFRNIYNAAELYYANNLINKENIDSSINVYDKLELKGSKPENVQVYINQDGKIQLASTINGKCYMKSFNSDISDINGTDDASCEFDNDSPEIVNLSDEATETTFTFKVKITDSSGPIKYYFYQKNDGLYELKSSGKVESGAEISYEYNCPSHLKYTLKVVAKDQNNNESYLEINVGPNCFVAGTKVYTEDGYKNIEDIKVGEKVYALDLETNNQELKEVKRTILSKSNELYYLKIDDELVQVTPRHQFYIIDKGWVRAYDLEVGDQVMTKLGNKKIQDIDYKKLDEPIDVYNLEVEGLHNYLVTEYSILVHNKGSMQYEIKN